MYGIDRALRVGWGVGMGGTVIGTDGRRLTGEDRADLPDGDDARAGELAERRLEEEERNADEEQHDEEGQQEGTCKRHAAALRLDAGRPLKQADDGAHGAPDVVASARRPASRSSSCAKRLRQNT